MRRSNLMQLKRVIVSFNSLEISRDSSTPQISAIAPICFAQNDDLKTTFHPSENRPRNPDSGSYSTDIFSICGGWPSAWNS